MNNEQITPLTVRNLLSEGKYRIPVYQRNYDWGEKETLQLLEDIADYASRKGEHKYYIGSVVVFVRSKGGNEYFETIDGQQRLTTLTIIMCALRSMAEVKNLMEWYEKANISYDHRPESDEAIRSLESGQPTNHPAAVNIEDVYGIIMKNIPIIVSSKPSLSLPNFVRYLLDSVVIMRIPVPQDTDLNHYFEIMNSRGEQLEKHEVLKANLMDNLEEKGATMCLFNDLWEACSDMTTYVQMKMRPALRTLLFSSNWADLCCDNFDDLLNEYETLDDNHSNVWASDEYKSRSLTQLFEDAQHNIKYSLPDSDNSLQGGNERFGSVINFPNFLLQTLKVMYNAEEENYAKDIDEQIKLDDKQLIDIFQHVLSQYSAEKRKDFTKRFIMALLRLRFLFDKYVIKRENYNNREGWSLKSLKQYTNSKVNYVSTFPYGEAEEGENDIGKDIRMLEAMFHVSAPTQIYKHWLNAVLYYLYQIKGKNGTKPTVDPTDMRRYLYQLACSYMLDQYITDEPVAFEDIIYSNEAMPKHRVEDIKWEFINSGCDVKNFIFNFYDYAVWKYGNWREIAPNKYKNFDFTYRTSVEHFYPQVPQKGYDPLDERILNSFGNLCLISRGMNSKFSNNMPVAKFKNFGNDEVIKDLSIKLNEMMDVVKKKGDWKEEEIEEFERKAKEHIISALNISLNKNSP